MPRPVAPDAIQNQSEGLAVGQTPTPTIQVFYNNATRDACAAGDYNAIKATEKQAARGFLPNLNSISRHGAKAFASIKNKDGSKHNVCASEESLIWASVAPAPAPGASASGPSLMLQVTIGTCSMAAGTVRISIGTWDLSWGGAIGTIAGLVTFMLSEYLRDRVLGYACKTAIGRAIQLTVSNFAAFAPQVAGVVGKFVTFAGPLLCSVGVGIAIWWGTGRLVNLVWRGYTLRFGVFNWLTYDWKVVDWYSDNAKVGGGEVWKQAVIPGVSAAVNMPDGTVVPSEVSIARYDEYVYQNRSTLMEGLGIAMKIVKKADESKGFLVKYGLWRLWNNQIGLQTGLDTDLKTFYDDADTWVSGKNTSVQYDGVTLTATTDALGGAPDKLYRFDVHIGVELL